MRWLASVFRKKERDLDRELRFHLEEQIKANLARGLSAAEARREANLEFGGLEQIKEECRDERPSVWFDQFVQDLRYAARRLARSPGFTAVAVLTLAVGIGSSTAIFTVVNSVLLKPIPYPDSERLVAVHETRRPEPTHLPIAPANYQAWAAQSGEVFADLYAERTVTYNLSGIGEPIRIRAARDTERFFTTLGVQPAQGRAFHPDEFLPGNDHVVVINHGFWQRQFGGRPDIVGETIRLDGQPCTIVGIMPPDFQRDGGKDLVMPLALSAEEWKNAARHYLAVFARLKPGVSLEVAEARMTAIAGQLEEQHPDTNRRRGAAVVSILENRTGETRPLLFSLAGAVLLLLLIACTNVANLLLVRAAAREREISVRLALGATRWRLVRQLLVESLLLALGGALGGLAIAKAGLILLLDYLPRALPRPNYEIVLDGRAVAVALALAVLTGLGFGLVPALQGSRGGRLGAPRPASGRSRGRARRQLGRYGFVVAEIGLALILLSGAGLLVRNFAQIAAFDPGFKPQGVVVLGTYAPREKYDTPEKREAFAGAVLDRLRARPDVIAAGVTQALPLSGGDTPVEVEIEGRVQAADEVPIANCFAISSDYIAATGIRLVSGRVFTPRDRTGSAPVTIISESAAAEWFPGLDPIGRHVRPGIGPHAWSEVVGVVSNVRSFGGERPVRTQVYVPFAQIPVPSINFVVRVSDGAASVGNLRHEVYAVDGDQPVSVDRFESLLTRSFARQQFALALFAVFSAMALLFAAVGIYSVVAFSVARRTGEFGIRIALGARPADLFRFVMAEAGRIAGYGVLVGVAGTFLLGRLVHSFFYLTPVTEPLLFGAIAALLFAVALTASVIPARRATKINPLTVLKTE